MPKLNGLTQPLDYAHKLCRSETQMGHGRDGLDLPQDV